MIFCNECDNMLYLRFSEKNVNDMIHYCRHCSYTKPAEAFCLEYNTNQAINSLTFINKYTHLDPTLPHTHNILCANATCSSNTTTPPSPDIVIFKPKITSLENIFICFVCQHNWKNIPN